MKILNYLKGVIYRLEVVTLGTIRPFVYIIKGIILGAIFILIMPFAILMYVLTAKTTIVEWYDNLDKH